MRTLDQLCLDVLRAPGTTLQSTLVPVAPDVIRARAPGLVKQSETLNFRTLTAEPDGLFDYKVFGPGTVIDAPPIDDDAPCKPRKTRFARITLALPIPHPLFLAHAPDELAALAGWSAAELDLWRTTTDADQMVELLARLATSEHGRELVLHELPVLPPEFRPLTRLDDDRWQTSPLNDLYRRVITRNNRLARLVEANPGPPPGPVDTVAPPGPAYRPSFVELSIRPVVDLAAEQRLLADSILALFENEDRPEPLRDPNQQPLMSLRGLCGGTAGLVAALTELDRRHVEQVPTDEPVSGRLYRATAAVFAFGFELRA